MVSFWRVLGWATSNSMRGEDQVRGTSCYHHCMDTEPYPCWRAGKLKDKSTPCCWSLCSSSPNCPQESWQGTSEFMLICYHGQHPCQHPTGFIDHLFPLHKTTLALARKKKKKKKHTQKKWWWGNKTKNPTNQPTPGRGRVPFTAQFPSHRVKATISVGC